MNILNSALCALIFGLVVIFGTPVSSRNTHLLGAKECTWGPTYWCSNITNAKNCGAVRHCIQAVWEKQTVAEDNDSICQICLDMVKQARDQLESNETQNDLKAVFEGSCKLIPIKPVQKECMKLADNFIPELIETLASQMNPQMVCSVAGLCNNAAIDKMLAELPVSTIKPHEDIEPNTASLEISGKKPLSCTGCNNVATLIANKFHSSNHDDVLENLLHVCGRLSSFSDACSNIVLTYFNDIYDRLNETLSSESICHMSGVCSSKYHSHPEIVEIRPMSDVGVVSVKEDIPCELCEQLVGHLKDVLVANTTEAEFKQVLEGLCKQTKGFTKECLSIVDQYYDVIYKTLVDNLDTNGACFLIGVCPKGTGVLSSLANNHPIMPLLPVFPPAKIEVSIKEKPKKKLLGENEPKFTKEQINSMQLPIDKIMGAPLAHTLIENGESCTLCEYFLHFVQEALATPANEDKIKKVVSSSCEKFPTSLRGECHNFINMYGDAVIALLIQEIDPRQICPEMKLCPKTVFGEDMEVFAPQPIAVSIISTQSDAPSCPLCLFALSQAEEMIKNDKTKERVKQVLDSLCSHAPKKLQSECVDFVDTYSAELIQMLITDFTPQEICCYIKLCTETPLGLNDINIHMDSNEDIMTNEIPDNTINGSPAYNVNGFGPECILCKEIIKEALKNLVNKKSKDHIREELERACEKIHQIKNKCRSYIDKYGDKIIDLIMKELTAKEICRELLFCAANEFDDLEIDEAIKIDIIAIPSDSRGHVTLQKMEGYNHVSDTKAPPCALCEFIMVKVEQELKDKKTEEEIKNTIHTICQKLPKTLSKNCNKFVDQYADMILELLDTVPPKEICQKLQLCFSLGGIEHADEVVECGVCHGTVNALVPKIQENSNIETLEMIEHACENLPAKYYGKCSDLISYYGESILNLVKSNTDQSDICAHIGKCFKEEDSMYSFLRIGGEDSDAIKRNRRSSESSENSNGNPDGLVGADKCSWGPSYWCETRENADSCDTHKYCVKHATGYAKAP